MANDPSVLGYIALACVIITVVAILCTAAYESGKKTMRLEMLEEWLDEYKERSEDDLAPEREKPAVRSEA